MCCAELRICCAKTSAEYLILNGKAKLGDTVELLWRDELSTPFSRQIVFGDDGKPVSGTGSPRPYGTERHVEKVTQRSKGASETIRIPYQARSVFIDRGHGALLDHSIRLILVSFD